MGILALVRGFRAHHPLPKVMTEPLELPLPGLELPRLKCESAVDEFSVLYNLYATEALTPGEYWQAKRALFNRERESMQQTLRR